MGHAPLPRDLRGSTVGFVVTHSHEATRSATRTGPAGFVPSRVGGTWLSNERAEYWATLADDSTLRTRSGNRAGNLGNYAGSVFAARLDLDSMALALLGYLTARVSVTQRPMCK